MADITDKFCKASDGTQVARAAVVSTSRSAGGTVLQCDDLTGWAESTAVHFTTFQTDPTTGNIIDGSQQNFKGIVNQTNNSITNINIDDGFTDSGNQVGENVKAIQTNRHNDDLIDGLLNSLTQSGALKAGAVTSTALGSQVVNTSNIANGAITSDQLADGSVLPRHINDNPALEWPFGGGIDYSTNEQDTGLKWVNGKTVYQKTISTGAMPNNTTKNITHNIANLDFIIATVGYAYNTTNQTSYPIPYVDSGAVAANIRISVNKTYINLITGSNRSDSNQSYVTLYYTKTS